MRAATLACCTGMLAENEADDLRTAISQNLDCTGVVATTRRVLVRGTSHGSAMLAAQLEACRIACEHSQALCAHHASAER
ncbi:hypothetical protein [Streptomyces sp. NPDC059262]|uniref:hypothetical protein n=1 Tax=Streptomyces sp. NPDC059262 TaxID=3346797 RepID=UPI00369D1FE7